MIKKFNLIFLAFDVGIVLFCFLQNNMVWLINTQVAFVSSMAITIGSYLGYKNNIKKRLANTDIDALNNTPDSIDNIDDQFDLYSEEYIQNDTEQKELSAQEIKEVLAKEKQNLKNQKNTIKNTTATFTAITSFYRIFGYVLLIIGFFYLNNNNLLSPIAYMVGFLIVPIAVVVSKLIIKEN